MLYQLPKFMHKNQTTHNTDKTDFVDSSNASLSLAIKRFEDTLATCPATIQDMARAIAREFNAKPCTQFEQVNFYCHTRLDLLKADCETRLRNKLDDIELAEAIAIKQSLQPKKRALSLMRGVIITAQCSLVMGLSIWLWPDNAFVPKSKLDDMVSHTIEPNNAPLEIPEMRILNETIPALIAAHVNKPPVMPKNQLVFLAHNPRDLRSNKIQREKRRIKHWLRKIHNDPSRSRIYHHPNIDQKTLVVGIIESGLNPREVSPSGALGVFQIMPGLNGAYGNPALLRDIMVHNSACLPNFTGLKKSSAAISAYEHLVKQRDHFGLLTFLKAQKRKRSSFWQTFKVQQKAIYTNVDCSQWIASRYMKNLEKSISALNPRQVEYLSVMAYNMGLENSKRLITAMKKEKLHINPHSIIDYIDDKAFEKKIKRMVHQNYTHYSKKNQAKEIHRTIKRMKEARTYLARYLVTKELLQQNLAKQNKAKNQQAALPNHFSKWLAAKS